MRNVIVGCSLVGILLVVEAIRLFKTYAFYEEKKEFNVLRGQIPEFVENDITLAIRMNGEITESIPVKGDYNVEIKCDNAIGIWNYTKWKIDISEFSGEKVKCSLNFIDDTTHNNLSYKVNVGDYVSVTPILESFKIPSSLTGYELEQEINPSELNMWRVIKIYDDGTLDLVSEYVSSVSVCFRGIKGYQNYIGTLDMIGSAYSNSNYIERTRMPGYSVQTPFLPSSAIALEAATNNLSAPWSCSTGELCDSVESQGGGADLYRNDVSLIKSVYRTLKAIRIGTEAYVPYCLAERIYYFNTDDHSDWRLAVRSIDEKGDIDYGKNFLYRSVSPAYPVFYALRPIITLQSNLHIASGDGKSETTAWQLS